jgi:hypothetical protein
MIQDTWFEVGRLESLFIEILDDPTKKEVLLYPICYCQLVRKEGSFDIGLVKLLRCANKTFRSVKGEWQDILLELNLFQISTPEGKLFSGKDILTLGEEADYSISLLPEYRENFHDICSRLIRYWGILSKVSGYTRKNTASEYIHILSMVFNEGLFRESVYYSDILAQRFPRESGFWELVREMGGFYTSYEQREDIDIKRLLRASALAKELGDIYYSVDVKKLREDLERLRKSLMAGGQPSRVRIELFTKRNKGGGFITRIIDWIKRRTNLLRKNGGKRWILMNSGTDFSYCTEAYLRRRRLLQTSI